MNLSDWRKEIDEIDAELVKLLNRRTNAVCEVGILKAKANLPIIDPDRESQILQKINQQCSGEINNDAPVKIFRKIIRESRKIQIQIKTDYLKQGIRR